MGKGKGGQRNQPFVYTPHKRRGPISAEFSSPGPAAICLPSLIGVHHVADSNKAAAPAFSFAGRHEVKVESAAPAPNSYNTSGLTAKGIPNQPAL